MGKRERWRNLRTLIVTVSHKLLMRYSLSIVYEGIFLFGSNIPDYMGLPHIVVIDIDGTISEASNRLHLLPSEGKGELTEHWNDFNLACDTDEPIQPVINMVQQIASRYTVWFVTGRSEIARDKTRSWLRKHVTRGVEPLLTMRHPTDHRRDAPVKLDLLKRIGLQKIAFAIEDKIEVARAFRKNGILTLMVREYSEPMKHQL